MDRRIAAKDVDILMGIPSVIKNHYFNRMYRELLGGNYPTLDLFTY